MNKVGEIIRKQKELKGLTTYKLAKNTGLHIQTVINIENGKSTSLKYIDKVLEHLGGSLEVKWDGGGK